MTSLTLPLVFNLSHVHLSDEQFYQLCINNPDISLERNAQGALIVINLAIKENAKAEVKLLK